VVGPLIPDTPPFPDRPIDEISDRAISAVAAPRRRRLAGHLLTSRDGNVDEEYPLAMAFGSEHGSGAPTDPAAGCDTARRGQRDHRTAGPSGQPASESGRLQTESWESLESATMATP
jgi:hypothetical protein